MTRDIADRLWSRVQKGDEATCWLWLGAVNENGYGRMGGSGASRTASTATSSPTNTYWRKEGRRMCRQCRRDRDGRAAA